MKIRALCKLIIFLIIDFSSFLCYSQSVHIDYFSKVLEVENFEFNMPKKFHETSINTGDFFHYSHLDNNKYLYPFNGKLISENGNVIIGFQSVRLNPENDKNPILQKIFKGRTVNTEYLLPIRHKADILNGKKITFYKRVKSKKLYNATVAGNYSFDMEIPYEGKFDRCIVVFLHKNNCSDAEVYYFFNSHNTKSVRSVKKAGKPCL